MTISKRLTRAGLAFTVFGLCASMLPNSATAITGADACGTSNSGTSGRGIKSSVVGTDVAIAIVVGGGLGYLAATATHAGSTDTSSNLPSTAVQKPTAQPVSETTQRRQLQQLKGFAYNGQ